MTRNDIPHGQARVLLTFGDQAELVTALYTADAPLRVPAARIAEQAGLPVNELPGRRFTVASLTRDDADGFTLLDDPRA
ncbi:hypothetical protein [Planotetraspora sp. GP83]|uniref:hypothetical protein n=1 Tax=Planotetraspora sp. GP83 TaxID=3156264 RepID=UPI003516EAD6